MIGHIIFLISFASVVLMTAYLSTTAEYYRRKSEKLKIEADFVKQENGQLINRLLNEKINNRSLTFQNTNTKTVPIKEIRLAVQKDLGLIKQDMFAARELVANMLAKKMLEEDVIKIEAHELYYDVSIYVIKKSWGDRRMKTKREVLEEFAKNGDCENINCGNECPYTHSNKCLDLDLRKIGAMAILRMFKEKKKPILEVGTKIKFSDGKIATIILLKKEYCLMFESHIEKIYYLVGRTWKVEE